MHTFLLVQHLRREMCVSRFTYMGEGWGDHMGGRVGEYAGGIQTVVSAGNASLLLPVLLKSSLAVALFGAHALDISVP